MWWPDGARGRCFEKYIEPYVLTTEIKSLPEGEEHFPACFGVL